MPLTPYHPSLAHCLPGAEVAPALLSIPWPLAVLLQIDKHRLVADLEIRYRDLLSLDPSVPIPAPASLSVRCTPQQMPLIPGCEGRCSTPGWGLALAPGLPHTDAQIESTCCCCCCLLQGEGHGCQPGDHKDDHMCKPGVHAPPCMCVHPMSAPALTCTPLICMWEPQHGLNSQERFLPPLIYQ